MSFLKKVTTIIFLLFITNSFATEYYSDPVNGDMNNDGLTESTAWGSLKAIFDAGKTFQAGDTIFLMSGAHGEVYITGENSDYVTIKALKGHSPKIASVLIQNAKYWTFEDLIFTIDGSGGAFTKTNIFRASPTASYLKITNCNFYVAESSASWSKADWDAKTRDVVEIAIYFEGANIIFNNNIVKNVYHAVFFAGQNNEIKNNIIDNFGADAIRILASNTVFENNIIRDAYIEDYLVNHDDAIQMYDATDLNNGILSNIVIRNNIIFSFADPITQAMVDDHLVGYSMQGIFNTDGHIENSTIENNLIVSDHYHGITLLGAQNCKIQNNTVLKSMHPVNPTTDAITWIQLADDKNGNQSLNNIVRNNLTTKLTTWTYPQDQNITEYNLIIDTSDYINYFMDAENFIFQLKKNSPAIDAGVNTDISTTDLAGNTRLVGAIVDCGAYEYQGDDTIAPSINKVPDTYIPNMLKIYFSEAMDKASCENIINYSIDNGTNILSAKLESGDTIVTLIVSSFDTDINYTLHINNVKDKNGNIIAPNSSKVFAYHCSGIWASSYQDDQYGTNPPENAFDGDLATRWSAEGTQWIQRSYCKAVKINSIEISFYNGDQRVSDFSIETSLDGIDYKLVFQGQSSGTTTNFELFDFDNINARYVKITGVGNSVNNWNSYNEIKIDTSINTPPVLSYIENQNISEKESLNINITASDADNDSLYFIGENFPEFIKLNNINSNSAVLDINPQTGDAGNYSINIIVSDGIATDNQNITITVSQNTGLKYLKNDIVKIYPNPSPDGSFNIKYPIKAKNVYIKIYTLKGTLVFQKKIQDINNNIVKLKTKLNQGFYILQIANGKNIINKKIKIN